MNDLFPRTNQKMIKVFCKLRQGELINNVKSEFSKTIIPYDYFFILYCLGTKN